MAATDLERLVVQLSADIKKYENSLNRAMGVTNQRARAIENRFAKMSKTINAGAASAAVGIGKAFALIGGAAGMKSLTDTATRIDNALKVAGLSGEELERVYGRLRDSALANAAPLESLVTLYGRAAIVQKELGVSTEEMLGFTNNVAVALRVAGTDAQSASGALLQLSQALGSGVVRAEEFNSILEGALPIAQAAAAGLKEAGGSVAKLRQLVVDGKISSEVFFRAFETGSVILKDKVAGATLTLDQRLENLRTSLVDAAKRFNNSSKAGNTFGEAIDNVADFVNGIDFDGLISQITDVINEMRTGIKTANAFARSIGEVTGLDYVGKFLTGGAAQRSFLGGALTITSTRAVTDRINDAFEGEIERAGELTAEAIKNSVLGKGAPTTPKGGRLPADSGTKFTPVSLADFDGPPSKGKGKKGRGSDENDLQREIKQIEERTAAIHAGTEAQRGLNPLVNDYGFAVEKAAAQQELLNAAKNAGLIKTAEMSAATPKLAAEIDNLSTAYANAVVASEQLAESQDEIRQRAEDAMATAKDVTRGLIDGFVEGASAADMLANSLKRIGDALINDVLDSIFKVNGAGGGGILSSIFGGLGGGGSDPWAGLRIPGRASGGPVSAGKPYIVGERRPELFVPNTSGTIVPKVPTMPNLAQKGGGGSVSVTFSPTIDARGADQAAIDRLERGLAKTNGELESRIMKVVRDRPKRGW